jgi:hypothetical protein
VYGRHSKKGIDTSRQFCGMCHSSLEFTGKVNVDGTVSVLSGCIIGTFIPMSLNSYFIFQPQKARAASGFSLFVKEHYGNVKAGGAQSTEKLSHGEVMKVLSKMYAEEKKKGEVIDENEVNNNNDSGSLDSNSTADENISKKLFSLSMR